MIPNSRWTAAVLSLFLAGALGVAEASAGTAMPNPPDTQAAPLTCAEPVWLQGQTSPEPLFATGARPASVSASCWGHCYVEINCPNGQYVGCYGGHSQSCRIEGSYVLCDGQYYSCEQCQQEQPYAFGCAYCWF